MEDLSLCLGEGYIEQQSLIRMSMLSTSFMEHLPKPSHSTGRQVSSHSQFTDNNTQFREEKLAEHI